LNETQGIKHYSISGCIRKTDKNFSVGHFVNELAISTVSKLEHKLETLVMDWIYILQSNVLPLRMVY